MFHQLPADCLCDLQDARSSGASCKARLPPALLMQFDLITRYSSAAGGFEEQLARQLLEDAPDEASADSLDRAGLKTCLQEHLRLAAGTAAPKLSTPATMMLQGYYAVSNSARSF